MSDVDLCSGVVLVTRGRTILSTGLSGVFALVKDNAAILLAA